jgi:N-acetyl-gamma-glutamyl-phosphate reductase
VAEKLVEVASLEEAASLKTLDAEILKDTNRLKIHVFGNDAKGQARVVAALDQSRQGRIGRVCAKSECHDGLPGD